MQLEIDALKAAAWPGTGQRTLVVLARWRRDNPRLLREEAGHRHDRVFKPTGGSAGVVAGR